MGRRAEYNILFYKIKKKARPSWALLIISLDPPLDWDKTCNSLHSIIRHNTFTSQMKQNSENTATLYFFINKQLLQPLNEWTGLSGCWGAGVLQYLSLRPELTIYYLRWCHSLTRMESDIWPSFINYNQLHDAELDVRSCWRRSIQTPAPKEHKYQNTR